MPPDCGFAHHNSRGRRSGSRRRRSSSSQSWRVRWRRKMRSCMVHASSGTGGPRRDARSSTTTSSSQHPPSLPSCAWPGEEGEDGGRQERWSCISEDSDARAQRAFWWQRIARRLRVRCRRGRCGMDPTISRNDGEVVILPSSSAFFPSTSSSS